jgi:hypothetical protein
LSENKKATVTFYGGCSRRGYPMSSEAEVASEFDVAWLICRRPAGPSTTNSGGKLENLDSEKLYTFTHPLSRTTPKTPGRRRVRFITIPRRSIKVIGQQPDRWAMGDFSTSRFFVLFSLLSVGHKSSLPSALPGFGRGRATIEKHTLLYTVVKCLITCAWARLPLFVPAVVSSSAADTSPCSATEGGVERKISRTA